MLIEIQIFSFQVSDQGVRVEPKNLRFKQTIQMTSLVESLAGGALCDNVLTHSISSPSLPALHKSDLVETSLMA